LTQADPDRAISESGSSRGSHTASYHGSPQSARLLLDTSEEEGSLHLDKGSVENLGVGSASDRLQDWHSRLEEDQLSFGSSSSQDARDMEELLGLLSGEFVSPQPRAPDDVEILSGATPTLDADGVIMRDSQGNLILNSGHAKPFKVFV